jgi:ABC-2 type transport system ATP-binding protein
VTFRLANGADLRAVRSAVAALPEVAEIELDEKTGRITAFPAAGRLPLGPVNRLAEQNGWHLAELELESGRLDEVFRSITGGASA